MANVRRYIRGSVPGQPVPILHDRELIKDSNTGDVYIGHNGSNKMVSNNNTLQQQIDELSRRKILNVPNTLIGQSRNIVRVRADEAGFEFVDFAVPIDFISARNQAELASSMALQSKEDAEASAASASESFASASSSALAANLSASIAQSSVSGFGSDSIVSDPVAGAKTVTATAASLFAGASRLSGRSKLAIRNDDPAIRIRIGPSGVSQQSGMPIEPGGFAEFLINRAETVEVYAISEGAAITVEVWES